MADLMRSLVHLEPPRLVPLALDRFSPYHERPDAFGLVPLGPRRDYGFIHPSSTRPPPRRSPTRSSIATPTGASPRHTCAPFREVVEAWRATSETAFGSLRYRRHRRGLTVTDRRPGLPATEYRLGGAEAAAYLACEDGATLARMDAALGAAGFDLPAARSRTSSTSASRRVSSTVTARTTWPWRCRRQAAPRRPDGRQAYSVRTPRTGSARCGDGQIEQTRRGRHAAVVHHDPGELITEQLRRRQVDGIEAPQHAGVDDRRGVEKLFVDRREIEPLQEASRPRERRRPWPRTARRTSTRARTQEAPSGSPARYRRSAADSASAMMSFTAPTSRGRPGLSLPGPDASQDGARARPTGHGGQRRTEVEQVSGWRDEHDRAARGARHARCHAREPAGRSGDLSP